MLSQRTLYSHIFYLIITVPMTTYLAAKTIYRHLISIMSSSFGSPPTTPNDGQPSGRYPISLDPMQVPGDPHSDNEHEIPYLLLNNRIPEKDWHGKDPVLRMFDYLELQDYGHAFGPYWIAKSSLDGDIHHLFRDLVEIPGLKPALILASKFLSEATLLPFWHALIFNEYTHMEQETEEIGWPCNKILLNPEPLSEKDLERTTAALVRIAKDVNIKSHSHPCFEYCWSFTKRSRRHIKNEHPEGESGTASSVTLSPKTLELLHPDCDIPPDQRNRISLMFAVNLCHEFAHAVFMFREPLPLMHSGHRQPPGVTNEIEPFINNDRLPELGQAWESIIFGGHLSSLGGREDCKYGVGLTKWPSSETAHGINPITRAVVPVARVGDYEPKWETLYVVPMDFVEKLFNKTYWKVDVKEKGTDALRFRKKFGCRKRNYDWIDHGLGGDGYASDDSERGRHADKSGIVRPGQPRPPPSPSLSALDEEDYASEDNDSFSDFAPEYTMGELGEEEEEDGYSTYDELEYSSTGSDEGSIWELETEDLDFPPIDIEVMGDWLESELYLLNNPMPGGFPSDVDFVIEGVIYGEGGLEEGGGGDGISGGGIWGVGYVEETDDSEVTYIFPAIDFADQLMGVDA